MGIIFNHKKLDNGEEVIEYFRYTDGTISPDVICELVDNALQWHITVDASVKKHVENEYKILRREIDYNNFRLRGDQSQRTMQTNSTWRKYEPKNRR